MKEIDVILSEIDKKFNSVNHELSVYSKSLEKQVNSLYEKNIEDGKKLRKNESKLRRAFYLNVLWFLLSMGTAILVPGGVVVSMCTFLSFFGAQLLLSENLEAFHVLNISREITFLVSEIKDRNVDMEKRLENFEKVSKIKLEQLSKLELLSNYYYSLNQHLSSEKKISCCLKEDIPKVKKMIYKKY